ncbi:MAG: amidase [Wenzhouxiangellaceae bacterium]
MSQALPHQLFTLDAASLREAIVAGEYSASEVLEIYLERLQRIDQRCNAIVAPLYDQARGRAAELDQTRARGEHCGPLHGVPITIKESFDYAGTATTGGLPCRRDHRAAATSPLVAALEQAGAVVMGKTNVPELLVYFESDNPVYGRTDHPWRADRSPGGSSGGEAAAVAGGGSVLGLGSDLAGSIRVPAHYCGIHGFLPTARRLTHLGSADEWLAPGQEAIVDQPGPLARRVSDLALVMKLLTADGVGAADPALPPVAAVESKGQLPAGLRLGYYLDDGFFSAAPALQRLVREAVAALEAAGVEMVPFQPPQVEQMMSLYFSLLAADGGDWARPLLRGRGHDHRVMELARIARLSGWQRRLLAAGLELFGQRKLASAARRFGRMSASQYWRRVEEQRCYIAEFDARLRQQRLSGLICPVAATPALTHGAGKELTGMGSYTMLFNLLGMPAGCVAAGRVRAAESGQRTGGRDRIDRVAARVDADSAGLPVGVQVAGRRWRDGLVLDVMACLEQHFQQQTDYPVWPQSIARVDGVSP